MRFHPEIALARLQLAELLLASDPIERVEALVHLEAAIIGFADMEMLSALEQARHLQERATSRRATRPSYPDGLSQREVEVIALVGLNTFVADLTSIAQTALDHTPLES